MEENKTTATTVTEEKKEKKEGFLAKVGAFVKNPTRGRPIKNAGWMLGGAAVLTVLATVLAGRKNDSDDDSDYECEE